MSFSDNPYQASQPAGPGMGGPPSAQAAERVKIPALLLLILAPIHIVAMLIDLAFRIYNSQTGNVLVIGDAAAPGVREGAMIGVFIGGAVDLFAVICQIVIAIGALKMMRLQSRQMAFIACVLSCIPCISGCCVLGIPLGIWGLVVLNDPQVKRSFAN